MEEAFDAMGNHTIVTLFLGFIIIFVTARITDIFNNNNDNNTKDESE